MSLDDPAQADWARRQPGEFLGRFTGPTILDEIQYAPEAMLSPPSYWFWRTAHGDEVDLLMETAPETFAAIECKTSERVTANDLKGVRRLSDEYGEGSIALVRVVCRTPTRYPLGDAGGAMAVPLSEALAPTPAHPESTPV